MGSAIKRRSIYLLLDQRQNLLALFVDWPRHEGEALSAALVRVLQTVFLLAQVAAQDGQVLVGLAVLAAHTIVLEQRVDGLYLGDLAPPYDPFQFLVLVADYFGVFFL